MQLKINTNHITRIFIGLIFLTGSLILIYRFYHEIIEFKWIYNKDLTFNLAVKLIYHSRTFFNPIILSIAMIGLFIKKPIGWIFTNNIFTYIFFIVFFLIMPIENVKWYYYTLSLIPIGFIILMHGLAILDFYKINRGDLLTYNLITIATGMALALLWGYFKLHPWMDFMDIIYKQ